TNANTNINVKSEQRIKSESSQINANMILKDSPALKRFSEHRIKTGSSSQSKGYQHKEDIIASGQIILPHHSSSSSSSLSKQQQRKIIEDQLTRALDEKSKLENDLTITGNKFIKVTHVFFLKKNLLLFKKINSLFAYCLFFIQKKKQGQNQKIA
ncbi:hypothetical protein RFI_29825, partial [Reticulomyxa filosa]